MAANGRLSGEDYAEIQNLYAYYNLCSDAGDAEGYASCFTRDGVLASGPSFRVQGRDNFIAFKKKDLAGRGGRYRRHWNGSIHLEKLDENTVRGRCYLAAYNGMPGSLPELADVGVYEDRVVRTPEGWRFAERRLAFDATSFKPPA